MNLIYQESGDLQLTRNLAQKIATLFFTSEPRLKLLILKGDLGAGKTTFASHLASFLGVKEIVNSPTFTILKQYKFHDLTFNHFDFYRLDYDSQDFDFIELIKDNKGLSIIEWYDNFPIAIPDEHLVIEFQIIDQNERTISIYSPTHQFKEIV
ncbi:MAG: tRNA (adenosine(37)-N6)-threonylcarbamoyltransferase complex ATPase subunit type 1 TsaE [Acholeplasmatales bacterium]|jgi:tRNA threonylcarbamoyladenosine biosynthesis protein TsaE|nr:tRNA (adenosine(37)-N6)-threonylcarbamoyltransferase complex ATPase subunit type 1 TsaE [Acholeplasmatales bacterium]